MASLEELGHELADNLTAAEADGRITRPYEIELIAGDDEPLAAYQVSFNGKWKLTTSERDISHAALPITIAVEDSTGRKYEMVWSPARPI